MTVDAPRSRRAQRVDHSSPIDRFRVTRFHDSCWLRGCQSTFSNRRTNRKRTINFLCCSCINWLITLNCNYKVAVGDCHFHLFIIVISGLIQHDRNFRKVALEKTVSDSCLPTSDLRWCKDKLIKTDITDNRCKMMQRYVDKNWCYWWLYCKLK